MNSFIKSTKYSIIKREQFKYLSMMHEDWTIYIVISGAFRCKFNNKEDIIQKGDLYIIPPFVKLERSVIDTITVHFIRFELDETILPPFDLPEGKLTLADNLRLQSTLQMFNGLSKIPYHDQNHYLSHLLFDILFQNHYERSNLFQKQTCINDPLVADVLKYFKQNYAKKLSIKDIAADFSISPSGLILKFRKSTGILPMRHLINIRIKNAKHLLVDTSLPLSEIAELTGFENGYYFSTAFKKEVGLSPYEYRKTYLI